MPDEMQPQPLSLAHALRNRRPATRGSVRAPEAPVAAPVIEVQPEVVAAPPAVVSHEEVAVPEVVAAPQEPRKRTEPITPTVDDRIFQAAWAEGLADRVEERVGKLVNEQIERLTRESKVAERAQVKLDESLGRAVKANPERIALLEGENARHLTEIQNLQAEIARQRRALRVVHGGGMKAFWRRLGEDLTDLSEDCKDLIDVAPKLHQGEVSPEVGRRIAAYLKTTGSVIEEYADNCTAYAEDEG